jgi:hypothetical protein
MTIVELRARLQYWKMLLNLEDWTITLRWGKEGELKDYWGTCRPYPDRGCAHIVLHEWQFSEYYLLHELGHVVLAGLRTSYPALEERAINRYARALAMLENIPVPPLDTEEE